MTKTYVPYSEEIANYICDEMASGRGLENICREDDGMPTARAVRYWLYKHPEFEAKYIVAQKFRTEALVDEIFQIADDASLDMVERVDKNGKKYKALDFDNIARSRLMVDTRKWAMGRFHSVKYGDKVAVGGDPSAPAIRHAIEFVIVDPADPAADTGSEEA